MLPAIRHQISQLAITSSLTSSLTAQSILRLETWTAVNSYVTSARPPRPMTATGPRSSQSEPRIPEVASLLPSPAPSQFLNRVRSFLPVGNLGHSVLLTVPVQNPLPLEFFLQLHLTISRYYFKRTTLG